MMRKDWNKIKTQALKRLKRVKRVKKKMIKSLTNHLMRQNNITFIIITIIIIK